MATEILLPKIGFSMEEGTLAEWLFGDGEQVAEGDVLYLLESDKSANEVEAPATGVLRVVKPFPARKAHTGWAARRAG